MICSKCVRQFDEVTPTNTGLLRFCLDCAASITEQTLLNDEVANGIFFVNITRRDNPQYCGACNVGIKGNVPILMKDGIIINFFCASCFGNALLIQSDLRNGHISAKLEIGSTHIRIPVEGQQRYF